jgi:hypothetical protein
VVKTGVRVAPVRADTRFAGSFRDGADAIALTDPVALVVAGGGVERRRLCPGCGRRSLAKRLTGGHHRL